MARARSYGSPEMTEPPSRFTNILYGSGDAARQARKRVTVSMSPERMIDEEQDAEREETMLDALTPPKMNDDGGPERWDAQRLAEFLAQEMKLPKETYESALGLGIDGAHMHAVLDRKRQSSSSRTIYARICRAGTPPNWRRRR